MIFEIDWQIFQLKYLNLNTIYVKENEDNWELYTYEGEALLCSNVKKGVSQEEDIMFIERYLNGRANIVKVMNIQMEKISMIPQERISKIDQVGGIEDDTSEE